MEISGMPHAAPERFFQPMSYQAVSWALNRAPMLMTDKGHPDTTCRFVLCVLAERAKEDGTDARPSILLISYETGFDERTVKNALRRLKSGALIAADGKDRNGVTRWKLSMHLERDPSEWQFLLAAADEKRRRDTAARAAHRARAAAKNAEQIAAERDDAIAAAVAEALAAAGVSGTQTTGQPTAGSEADSGSPGAVRYANDRTPESNDRTPTVERPDSGTQDHPNHPGSVRPPTTLGGHAAPQTPLRPVDPPGRPTDSRDELSDAGDAQPPAVDRDSRPREAGGAVRWALDRAPIGPGLVVICGEASASGGGQRGFWPSAVDGPAHDADAAPGGPMVAEPRRDPQRAREAVGRRDVDDGGHAQRRAM
ncbi:hypothetical protein [Micromonospora sp. NPDC049645]|uniref:hypothetical protein n=1 Tax=Micromonospora sp. NPDC049645 TaxID=3155508 RepID=UPI0034464371